MDLITAARARHSVRAYYDRPIEKEIVDRLTAEINEINEKSGLHFQLVTEEPKAFGGFFTTHYGSFKGVKNYFALIGKDDEALEEKCGYYGERLVLVAQSLGLNTCWVYLTYKKVKSAFVVDEGEKLCLVVALGYGETQGKRHKDKEIDKVVEIQDDDPDWFKNGVEGAMLAPTAVNQQKFFITRKGNEVNIKALRGPCSKIDLGIVKHDFELFAGKENFHFVESFSD